MSNQIISGDPTAVTVISTPTESADPIGRLVDNSFNYGLIQFI